MTRSFNKIHINRNLEGINKSVEDIKKESIKLFSIFIFATLASLIILSSVAWQTMDLPSKAPNINDLVLSLNKEISDIDSKKNLFVSGKTNGNPYKDDLQKSLLETKGFEFHRQSRLLTMNIKVNLPSMIIENKKLLDLLLKGITRDVIDNKIKICTNTLLKINEKMDVSSDIIDYADELNFSFFTSKNKEKSVFYSFKSNKFSCRYNDLAR